MTRRNRDLVDILEDHEREIRRLKQSLARVGGGDFLRVDGSVDGTAQQSLLGLNLLAEGPTNEGGQVVFQGAGAFTTSMFLDRYQDSFRFIYNASVTAEITSAGEVKTTGSMNDYGLHIRGTDSSIGGMAVLHLVNADGGSAHVNDAWQMHHRGLSPNAGDLIFYYHDSSAPSWAKWLQFDHSLNEIQTTKDVVIGTPTAGVNFLEVGPATAARSAATFVTAKGGNIHFGYQHATDSPSYMTFDSSAFWQWRSFNGSAYTTEMQLDTVNLTLTGVNLNMNAKAIVNVSQIDFNGVDNWIIDDAGDDFRVTESGLVRFRIRDDDNDGYHEFIGTSGTILANLDGNDWAVAGGIRAGSTAALITDGFYYHIPTTTGVASNMHTAVAAGSTYYILRSTSARKFKKHIDYNKQAMLADMEIKPATFWRDDDQEWFIGLIADDLAEEDYRLATYVGKDGSALDGRPQSPDKNGIVPEVESPTGEDYRGRHVPFNSDDVPEPDNVQTLAVLAVLAAKANRSDDREHDLDARLQAVEDALRELLNRG
jgi:hypothetical protein